MARRLPRIRKKIERPSRPTAPPRPAPAPPAHPTGAPAAVLPPPPPPPTLQGPGLRVRLSAIPDVTFTQVLRAPLYLQSGILDEWHLARKGAHEDVDTAVNGQFSYAGSGPQLKTTSINSLALASGANWLMAQGMDDDYLLTELDRIIDARTPFDLLITWPHGTIEAHFTATLRGYESSIKAGEPDTRYFTLEVTEWRNPNPKRAAEGAPRKNAKLPTTHALRGWDTLMYLSKYYYGDYNHWRDIAKANGITNWGSGTPLYKRKGYKVGTKIKIPAVKK